MNKEINTLWEQITELYDVAEECPNSRLVVLLYGKHYDLCGGLPSIQIKDRKLKVDIWAANIYVKDGSRIEYIFGSRARDGDHDKFLPIILHTLRDFVESCNTRIYVYN